MASASFERSSRAAAAATPATAPWRFQSRTTRDSGERFGADQDDVLTDTDGPGGDLTGPGLKLSAAMLKVQTHVSEKTLHIDEWAKQRRVLASFIGLLVGEPFKVALDVTIEHLAGLHAGRKEKYNLAKCDSLFVKVWNSMTIASALQLRNEAKCNADSPVDQVETLVGRNLEAFGELDVFPSIRDMPHIEEIEQRRDDLANQQAMDRLKAKGGGTQRAGGDGDGDNFQALPAAPASAGANAPEGPRAPPTSGSAFRAGKGGRTFALDDPNMELVFRLPEATRAALIGKNPVGPGGVHYCRICQTHGSVYGLAGSPRCSKADRKMPDGTVQANLHELIPVGTVVAREFLAMMAVTYGGIHSGPYYCATAEERQQAHNAFMRGPATVKCGGGALAAVRDDHPCLPLERTADGGLGRMFAANGMKLGDEYRSDEQGLEAVVSSEVDASWVFSDHSLAVPAGPGIARTLSARNADALVVRREVPRRIVESRVAHDEQKDVRLVVQNSMAHVLEAQLKTSGKTADSITDAELDTAHQRALDALEDGGDTRRVRSAAAQAQRLGSCTARTKVLTTAAWRASGAAAARTRRWRNTA